MPTEGFRGTRIHWWALIAVYMSLFLVAGLLFLYIGVTVRKATAEERKNDRKWCALISTYDDAYRATPPQTPTGKKLAAEIHQLRSDFGC